MKWQNLGLVRLLRERETDREQISGRRCECNRPTNRQTDARADVRTSRHEQEIALTPLEHSGTAAIMGNGNGMQSKKLRMERSSTKG